MPLTPYDIHNKEFSKAFRGYDVDEVNDFLDQIIKDFELLTREKLELEQQVEDLQAELERLMEGETMFQTSPQSVLPSMQQSQQLHRYQSTEPMHTLQPSAAALSSMEQSIHKSIRVAQEVSEEVRLNAKKEAELIVQEAEKNADRLINEALQEVREIHTELSDLKQKATIYRARFRTLVQSHLDILENSDWEYLEEIDASLENNQQQEEFEEHTVASDIGVDHSKGKSQDFMNLEDSTAMDEAAATHLEDENEGEPKRDLRRTSRKLKRKAMY